MCQNMAKLQDTLRQMHELQQAYEAARQAKTYTQQFSTVFTQPQAFPPHAAQVVQAPTYFAKAAPTAAVRPTPHMTSASVHPVAPQA
uniref:Uncharacterized protein n=1 Tax=Oryza sativa subsp. japonica TaxID=39947 RepID=Q6YUK8_ORYSJ|nr:hypothetical protein [Oryza sativa Japonica Group]